jgi:predicted Zn-dependent protease
MVCLWLTGCAVQHKQLTYQVVPAAETPSAEETAYGHRVYLSLREDYPVDADSDRLGLLKGTFDHLAGAAGIDPEDWHVHLLYAPDIADVRSVEGNYLFVWSGLFDIVENEDELAGLLACEIAHVLAGHTEPVRFTPASELLFGLTDAAATIGLMILTQGALNVSGTGMTRWAYVEAADLDPVDRVYTAGQLEEMAMIATLILEASHYTTEGLLDFWRRAGSPELPLQQLERLVRELPPDERLAILEAVVLPVAAGREADNAATDDALQTVDSGEKDSI